MSSALSLSTERRADGALLVAAVGEIDMSNAADFSAALSGVDDGPLIVDLTQVEYLDSAGLAVLFPHVEHLQLLASPLLAPVLMVAGLDDLTTVQHV